MTLETIREGDPEDYALGRALTALAVGMDRFERAVSAGQGVLDDEGLIPIYLGDDLLEPASYEAWEEVSADLARLRTRVGMVEEGARRTFLASMVESLGCAAEMFQGTALSYREKLERLVGVPTGPVDREAAVALQDGVDDGLRRAGFAGGTMAERVARWEAARVLEGDALQATFRELMGEAKRRTDDGVYDTGDYDMALAPVRGVPYTARCNFNKAAMDLNVDLGFSRPALKHLVCHEVFPGHATQLLSTRDAARDGTSPPDVLLCTLNGVTGAVQEGIGDQGVELIDWVEDDEDVLFSCLRRLRSAGQATAAWQLMEGGWSEAQARNYLTEEVCGQPAWVEGRLRFAQHPFRGPFIASYWHGDEAVREVRERTTPERRQAFIEHLYLGIHTPTSLRQFDPR